MEGPYRDLGSGFARLTGAEGARRTPSRLHCVEDALLELLRNARDASAKNVFVASSLLHRRYRTLTVIDDGGGIPDTHRALVFEPGVTTRHLGPVLKDPHEDPHGSGLSLYHIKNAALSAGVLSSSSPTAIKVTFDTHTLPERSLQSPSRPSRSNLLATLQTFSAANDMSLFYAPPARILVSLLENRIIQWPASTGALRERALALGLEVSLRTAQRVWRGEIATVGHVAAVRPETRAERRGGDGGEGPVLVLGEEERGAIADILRRAARAGYLELGELELRTRPGEVTVRARIYEPEEEYE